MQKNKRSKRNKTIDTTVKQGEKYLERCMIINPDDITNFDTLPLDLTICADSIEIMRSLPENSADLIIADPPYNIYKKFNRNSFNKMSDADYEQYTISWLKPAKRLLKDTGSIYVCCDWESSLIIGHLMEEHFNVRNRITWQREKGRGSLSNWKNSMEDIWFATMSDSYKFNINDVKIRRKVLAPYKNAGQPKDWEQKDNGKFRDTCPSNFWDDITVPFWSMPENTAHPTQKPEKLIARLILASSDEGDIVFDPFLGSGTTSVTAKKLGRHFLGIEIDKQYCVWAEQRLEMADTDKKIQGFEDKVFWERNALK